MHDPADLESLSGARLLVAGDTHANARWVDHLARTARDLSCLAILQLGDFGFFPGQTFGREFLDAAERSCADNGIELWWIDGNHDDHGLLAKLRADDAPVSVSHHITYLPRGCRLLVAGVTMGFLGGAFSVDWKGRTPGESWWPEELIQTEDVVRLGSEPLDVLVTHEAPAGIELPSSWRLPVVDQHRADQCRQLVDDAVRTTRPQLVLHGHWHRRHDSTMTWVDRATPAQSGEMTWQSTRVVGLGCDGNDPGGWAVLDLPSLELTTPTVLSDRDSA